jgi:hypothetical protein
MNGRKSTKRGDMKPFNSKLQMVNAKIQNNQNILDNDL